MHLLSAKTVGKNPTGHLPTMSDKSAKVTIKMVKLSNNFDKNLLCTYTQILDEKVFNLKGNKKLGCKKIYSLANLNSQEKRYH